MDAGQWSDALIGDDMLRTMYACCHPSVPDAAATALILKTLCGFSTAEIARAFLTSEDTISKRLYRAKEVFRQQELKLPIISIAALQSRTDAVLRAIYLLFNEGYNASVQDAVIRESLLKEAMLLCELLLSNVYSATPAAFALMALMSFQASRTGSRLSQEGNIILLPDQDRSRWDYALILRGNDYLNYAATGEAVSVYHLQAAIAWEHCNAPSFEAVQWERILRYYDWLMQAYPSAVAAVHRAVALMKVRGAEVAVAELELLGNREGLPGYYLYHAVLGECYAGCGRSKEAAVCFSIAMDLTVVAAEKALLQKKIDALFA
jgi:RNA polymerase sigma-70 factor (ECF subfamily)